jgi:predicted Zn-dependent protease
MINQYKEAKEYALLAYNLYPDKAGTNEIMLAEVYAEVNQPDSASYWLQVASTKSPITAEVCNRIGVAYGDKAKNYDKAIQYFQKAIELMPQNALFYHHLSVAYTYAGRYNEAIQLDEDMIRRFPQYPGGYDNLATIYALQGKNDLAEQYRAKFNQLTGSAR